MVEEQLRVQASSFGAAAAAYERGRPPYPAAAVDWLLEGDPQRVLDLGAGTGKLTRHLIDRGLDVVAVEPLAGMREELTRSLPGCRALEGSAEAIPLADQSVDAVLVAQAWHWMDRVRAAPEVARVLASDGHIGLVWNFRDERTDWVAQLGRIIHQPGESDDDADPVVGAPFGPLETMVVEWRHPLSPDGLIDMVASRSYVITRPPAERDALLAEVRALLATHPALRGRNELVMPYDEVLPRPAGHLTSDHVAAVAAP